MKCERMIIYVHPSEGKPGKMKHLTIYLQPDPAGPTPASAGLLTYSDQMDFLSFFELPEQEQDKWLCMHCSVCQSAAYPSSGFKILLEGTDGPQLSWDESNASQFMSVKRRYVGMRNALSAASAR